MNVNEGLARGLVDGGVVDGLNSLCNDEKAAVLQLRLMLMAGDLRKLLRVARIERHRFEFSVQGGRIDLLLFHADGGVSIIEAKPDADVVSVAAGIGQLCYYAAVLPMKFQGRRPSYINRFLCAPLAAEKSLPVVEACRMAGVGFIHLAEFSDFKSLIDALKSEAGQ